MEEEEELDLDSLLRAHGTSSSSSSSSSDDDGDGDGGGRGQGSNGSHRRTVDDILNDSDSSSSDEGIPRLSASTSAITLSGAEAIDKKPEGTPPRANTETLEESAASSPSLRRTYTEPSSFPLPSLRSFSSSRPLPSLFGGIRSNPKPGAALAAAAAASRSVPTPFAAAIKSRREASFGSLEKILQLQELTGGVPAEEESTDFEGFEGPDPSEIVSSSGELRVEANTRVGVSDPASSSSYYSSPDYSEAKDLSGVQLSEEISVDTVGIVESLPSDVGAWTVEDVGATDEGSKTEEALVDSNSVASNSSDGDDGACEEDGNDFVSVTEYAPQSSSPTCEDSEKPELKKSSEFPEADGEIPGDNTSHDGGATNFQEESNSRSDATELLEERTSQLESSKKTSRKADKKLRTSMKPLEWAEELEKRQAYSGLHWEEGVAAQPMRLEGIKRGPPAVGYLQVDADNVITRLFSSQAFQRDYGSPQVLAVHMNFIAIGMSKGVVLMVPSKYSAHSVDNMKGKMLILGSQSEKNQSPVTSMCFNQQGDLLLVGYRDGHLTVWDVQKATAAKIITGEHMAPVVHTLFLGQDSQVTRQFKAVTGDAKGLVLLHTFSVVPLFNHFSLKTQWLLDGQTTGTVLSASSLLMDDHYFGGLATQGNPTVSIGGLGSMVGGESGWKLFNDASLVEKGVVIFVTHQNALVVRLSPNLEFFERLSKPDGVREGSMPYTAWKCTGYSRGPASEHLAASASDKASWLAIAWGQKVQVKKLVNSDLAKYGEWSLDSEAIGVTWLDDQMLAIITVGGHLCLYAKDGTELHRTSFTVDGFGGDDIIAYHTYFTNIFGNPEKAYHNSIAVRGAAIYILGPMHLIVSRILPWKEHIQVLRKAGDWMGALDMAMTLYDGHAHGIIDLPRSINAIREVIMPYLVEMLLSYVDEVFSYISLASCSQIGKVDQIEDPNFKSGSMNTEMEEQFARVGGVAIEFCIHIARTDILFDDIFSKFVAAGHGGTFLEILEPYILKDMLGCLPPEIMQALVEHYSSKGWLQRVEQCVLHMNISSLDFNQVVRLCREHGLYGALIYLFNQGLDDFRTPLEELLVVIQNAQRADAAIGYRMLVYLKYCFLGLAFPPGHGTLPPSRLPSLRKELLLFLLEDSSALTTQVMRSFKASCGACPKLCYLLWLDTESTLDVLRFAFLGGTSIKSENFLNHVVDDNMGEKKEDASASGEDMNMIVQNLVNSLILFLDMDSDVIRSFLMDDSGHREVWPSKKDVGHAIEFIAHFVACKQATVSGKVVKHILEYLVSDDLSVGGPIQKSEAPKREKQVLSLLKVLPETEWDSSHVLNLCMKAQFHRACGLVHTIRGQYVPALDSYMKDVDEPAYAFAFIHQMLLKLKDTEYLSFRSAVLSRSPELVKLSREETFVLAIDHFSVQHIQSDLQSHPRSLFLFLKTIIDVHLRGTLKFAAVERSQISDALYGRKMKEEDSELETYLERLTSFPKILEHSPVHVDDETTELYLELLCQYERNSVLKFLEAFDNYRLEHCLHLCQEHGVNDAAAFLLERVGDIGNALVLLMTGLNEKFVMLATAVKDAASEIISRESTNVDLPSTILSMDEFISLRDVLHASIGLCQRNTQRLDPQESRSLWFHLLDVYCGPLKELYEDKEISDGRKKVGTLHVKSHLPLLKEKSFIRSFPMFSKGVSILRRVFSQFIREIVEGMVGYVPLSAIMAKLLSDNGNQEFGDFKYAILSMLGTYGYERRILGTAKSLIEDDTYYTMSLLRKGASQAYAPNSLVCCICGCLLSKESSSSGVRVFNCGHMAHLHCDSQEIGAWDRDSSTGCLICLPKRRTTCPRSKSTLMENGLVKNSISRSKTIKGITSVHHLHEPDAAEKAYGTPQMSRFEILNNLQKAQKSLQMDILPQLRLSPPAIYHEKVQKGSAILSREINNSVENENPDKSRQTQDPKSKGLSRRFPLKSSIFGMEKYRTR